MRHEIVQRIEWGHSTGPVGSYHTDDFLRAKSRPYCLKCGVQLPTGMTYDDWRTWNAECSPTGPAPEAP